MDVRAASSGAAEGIFGGHAIPGFRRLRQHRQHCLQLPGTFEDPRKTLRIARKRLAGAHIEPVILREGTSGYAAPRREHRWRHLIENFFCKIKAFRRIATRYEKTDACFASMTSLVALVLWTQ
jgi:hypothetical protein